MSEEGLEDWNGSDGMEQDAWEGDVEMDESEGCVNGMDDGEEDGDLKRDVEDDTKYSRDAIESGDIEGFPTLHVLPAHHVRIAFHYNTVNGDHVILADLH